ncbi:MAG: molybdate ABC transporter substrate-binding protein [Acidobacteria bacterium]|nr:molybdate ABC transporter substrate-binding protein [Acidobacteriota bacterium]
MAGWSWSRRLAAPVLLLGLLGWGCRAQAPGGNSLLLCAAASTTGVVEEIRDRYTRQTGRAVELNFGSTATLATQIRSGAEADLFLAADEVWAGVLAGIPGLVADRVDLLGNGLVVVLPGSSGRSLQSPRELLEVSLATVAMANPDSMVPAGLYAREALVRLGLWESLRSRMVYGENVRTALAYVETGSVAAGIVYRTDAMASSQVELAFEIAPRLHRRIRYPLLLLGRGVHSAAARHLFEYLQGAEAAALFRKHGFARLPETGPE